MLSRTARVILVAAFCIFPLLIGAIYAQNYSPEKIIQKNQENPDKLGKGYWKLNFQTQEWTFHPWEKLEEPKEEIPKSEIEVGGSNNIYLQREAFLKRGLSEKDFALHFWSKPYKYLCYNVEMQDKSENVLILHSMDFNDGDERSNELYTALSWQLWALLAEKGSGLDERAFNKAYSQIKTCE